MKKGKYDAYEIKKYEDHVVQDNFKFGDDKEIVRQEEFNSFAMTDTMVSRSSRSAIMCWPSTRRT